MKILWESTRKWLQRCS